MNKSWIVFLLLPSLTLGGCATIMKGEEEPLIVESKPAGAVVTVGEQSCHTPCHLDMPRRVDMELTMKKPGYEEVRVDLDGSSWDPWIYGNIVFLVGMPLAVFIDFYTGYAFDISPWKIEKDLVKKQ